MTDYNDGKWHGWNGGECPVHLKSEVQIVWQFTDGTIRDGKQEDLASQWAWLGNEHGRIVAFRVIKQHREPREVWVLTDDEGMSWFADPGMDGATLFREVLE